MKHFIITFLFLSILVACQPEEQVTSQKITRLETEMRKSTNPDTSKVRRLIDNYHNYREQHRGDSISPYYLLKEADLRQGVFDENIQAIRLYDQFIEYYPSHPLVPRAMFMKAYVHDEKLNQREEAAQAYEELLTAYPDNSLAADAANLLAMLRDTLTEEEKVAKWLEEARSEKSLNKKE